MQTFLLLVHYLPPPPRPQTSFAPWIYDKSKLLHSDIYCLNTKYFYCKNKTRIKNVISRSSFSSPLYRGFLLRHRRRTKKFPCDIDGVSGERRVSTLIEKDDIDNITELKDGYKASEYRLVKVKIQWFMFSRKIIPPPEVKKAFWGFYSLNKKRVLKKNKSIFK